MRVADDRGEVREGRAAWATAIAATAILSVSFGAPQLLVVALAPIAADLGGARAVPSLAASAAYFGAGLGGTRMLLDEKPVRLAKAENYQAIHLMMPRRGVAIHINAFNFPSWGLWEKAAVSLLAKNPDPSDSDIDAAMTNICRCGTYQRIRTAIHMAASAKKPAKTPA